ncbi:MAG: GntR family transcriptional regulator [Lachnospiraceae bacterium]
MSLKPIPKALTLKEQAYQSIKQAIFSNSFSPGTPLVEEQLSTKLSISRTPIRSALQQLVYENLAVSDATGHIYVTHITEKEVDDVTTMRSNMEPLGISLIEMPVSGERISELYRIHNEQTLLVEREPDNHIRYAELDTYFHNSIARLSNNFILIETIERIGNLMIRVNILSGTLSPHKKKALSEHAAIIEYLEKGQKEFAIVAMREHVRNVGTRILDVFN